MAPLIDEMGLDIQTFETGTLPNLSPQNPGRLNKNLEAAGVGMSIA